MAGALLGTCLGGPVGLLAGVKIGGLAAIGGSVFGKSPSYPLMQLICIYLKYTNYTNIPLPEMKLFHIYLF